MKFLLKAIALCIVSTFLMNCSKNLVSIPNNPVHAIQTKSIIPDESAIPLFHSTTNSLIVPQQDPYSLSFIYSVIDNDPHFCSYVQTNSITISPTHYILRCYPKNLEEIQAIENLQDVIVSYIPLNYKKLETVDSSSQVESTDVFPDYSKYSVDFQLYNSEGEPTMSYNQMMPVLYLVWPIDKPIPDTFDIEVDYEAFIPAKSPQYRQHSSFWDELESALINYSLDRSFSSHENRSNRLFSGYIYHYEPWRQQNIPIRNLRIRFQIGSNISDIYTDNNGFFSITFNSAATAEAVFQDTKWKIITTSSEAPQTTSLSDISNSWQNGGSILLNDDLAVTHIALDAYYYFSHPIPIIQNSDCIRIRQINTYSGHSGEFHPGLLGSSCIDVYFGIFHERALISLVCHELGHYNYYLVRGGFFQYTSVHRLFKESYADYSGWFVTRFFYKTLFPNITEESLNMMIDRQNQSWKKTDTGETSHYSPLFVDLIDSINQYDPIQYPLLNNDLISNVPHTVINEMIKKRIWADIKSVMNNYTGIYFSLSDYNSFIAPYDFYFTHD